MPLGERQIVVDCDVIQADGGTRCASITGGWVALRLAVNKLMKAGAIISDPIVDHVAAVSCGIYAGQPVLDLDYAEDSAAGTDGNFVLTGARSADRGPDVGRGRELSHATRCCSFWIWPNWGWSDWSRRNGRRWSSQMAKFTGGRLVVATHNAGKLEEIRRLLEPHAISVISAADLGLPEPPETETTFVGNARIKAHAAARATGLPALADDSGLEVDALGGAPGVYTADWAETAAGRDFGLAMQRTLE